MCKKATSEKSHLADIIDLVEVVYYLKQVFHLLFFKFHLAVKIDFVNVAYYLKRVFHLLYNKIATPAEALLYFFLIL